MNTIKFKVSMEKMISRLPSMFPFLNFKEDGTCEVVSAADGEQGSYGHIMADIKLPSDVDVQYKCDDGFQITLKKEKVYSYRTIIDAYYRIKNDTNTNGNNNENFDKFMLFVDKGMGLISISDDNKGILSPDNVYLGEAKTYYDKMVKMKKQIGFYENHVEQCVNDTNIYNAMKKKYTLMGGDNFKNEMGCLISQAESTATEYLGYAVISDDEKFGFNIDVNGGSQTQDKAKSPTLNFNINLNSTIKDLGLVTPLIEEWVAGKRYYDGEVVYYKDENGFGLTYEADLKVYDVNRDKFTIDEITYTISDETITQTISDKTIIVANIINNSFELNGITYDIIENSTKVKPRFTTGSYDSETEVISFDFENWKPQSLNWETEEKGKVTFSDEYVVEMKGTCKSHLLQFRRFETYLDGGDNVETPETYKDWLWYYRKGTIINRETTNDEMGNIAVLTYHDNVGITGMEAIRNDSNNDQVGANIEEEKEDIGANIEEEEDNKQTYVVNLAAYGDVLYNIEANNNDNGTGEITFTYYMGAHLKAQKNIINNETEEWYSVDDDGNYKYYFKNFEVDLTSKYGQNHWVEYVEKYIYNKYNGNYIRINDTNVHQNVINRYEYEEAMKNNTQGNYRPTEETIWTLVERGLFEDYINGYFDKDCNVIDYITTKYNANISNKEGDEKDAEIQRLISTKYRYLLYDKMEFDMSNNVYIYDMKVGKYSTQVPYVKTDYTTKIDIKHVDVEKTPLIRYDYYNGVSFAPSVTKDVNVERGLTQAFEKFIKFSEIKTFEDLENYANGGFFTLSKEDIDLG